MARVTFVSWMLLKLVALLCLVAAVALYEREERTIQRRAEELWIRVTYKRDKALSLSAAFIREIARLTGGAVDRIFGLRLISLQLIGVSFYLSLASFVLISLFSYSDHRLHLATAPGRTILNSLKLVGAALIPAGASWGRSLAQNNGHKASAFYRKAMDLGFRVVVILWYARLGWILLSALNFSYFAYTKGQGKLVLGVLALFGLGLGFSFLSDVLYIVFIRGLIKRCSAASTTSQVYSAVLTLGGCLLVASVMVVIPIVLGKTVISFSHGAPPTGLALAGFVIMCAWVFSLINLLSIVVGAFLAVILLLNHYMWPLIQRPIYAFQRYGLIANKKLLLGLGIGLLLLPRPATLQLLWEMLLKLAEKI